MALKEYHLQKSDKFKF